MKKPSKKVHPEMQDAFVDDNFEKMKLLISSGEVSVDERDCRKNSMTTPLMRSAINDSDLNELMWFVNNGADVNLKDGRGWTALHYACEYKNFASIKFLVNSGAEVNAKNDLGATPLLRLFSKNGSENEEIFIFLKKNGADPGIKNNSGVSVLDIAEDEINAYLSNLG